MSNVWELAESLPLNGSGPGAHIQYKEIEMEWFHLVADPARKVAVLEPHRLHIQSLRFERVLVWRGAEAEVALHNMKLAAAARGRGRAGARGGRGAARGRGGARRGGRRGRGRGREALMVAAEVSAAAAEEEAPIGDGDGDPDEETSAKGSASGDGSHGGGEDGRSEYSDVASLFMSDDGGAAGGGSEDSLGSAQSGGGECGGAGSDDSDDAPLTVLIPEDIDAAVSIMLGPGGPPDGARGADRRERMPALCAWPCFGGTIRYYGPPANLFSAECGRSMHGSTKCRLQRTSNGSSLASRLGAGRPVALLASWIKDCPPRCNDKRSHVHEWSPDDEQRHTMRKHLLKSSSADAVLRDLLSYERPKRMGEPMNRHTDLDIRSGFFFRGSGCSTTTSESRLQLSKSRAQSSKPRLQSRQTETDRQTDSQQNAAKRMFSSSRHSGLL